MENNEIFSQFLTRFFIERGSTLNYCKKFYPNENVKYKARTIQRYLRGERVPSFNSAKEILNNLDVEMKSEELDEMLKKSKLLKEDRYEAPLFCDRLNIRYSEIDDALGKDFNNSNEILEERLKQLNTKTVKEYVLKLIKKDIEESII